MTLVEQIEDLLKQRAAIDAQIEGLKAQAAQEFERVQAVMSQLGHPVAKPAAAPAPKKPHNPWDETDAGMGIGGRSELGNMSRQDFVDELAALRAQGAAKRKRA
jgi:hypothetical protein